MVKSNVRSVRRRQVNRRLSQNFDKKQQLKVRGFDRHIDREPIVRLSKTRIRWNRIKKWFSNLRWFRTSSIDELDLRSNSPRGAGAAWLRANFHQNLKMISTRDGRPV